MSFFGGVIGKVTGIYQWFFYSNKTVDYKRKRSSECNENKVPKKLRLMDTNTQTESFRRGAFTQFTSRPEKIQFMTKSAELYSPSVKKHLRPPQSWNMSNEIIEFSSDEDDNNDIQVIGEEPPQNRSSVSSLPVKTSSSLNPPGDGVEVLEVLEERKNVQPKAPQLSLSFHTSTPTSVSTSPRKNGRTNNGSMKKHPSSIKSSFAKKAKAPSTLNMTFQLDSKEKYNALLNSFMNHPQMLSTVRPSSFSNLQDVEKKCEVQFGKPLRTKFKAMSSSVKYFDLTEPKDRRKATHLQVQSTQKKPDDGDSDVEIIDVKPVARVNSYEPKLRYCRAMLPDWIDKLQENWKDMEEETARLAKQEKIKQELYSIRNQKRVDAVEERVRRYMSITDTVVLDEVQEEEEMKLPELTPEMEERVACALVPRPSNEVVAEGFSLKITRKDMHTLAKLNWLNDEVINFYMNLLIERGKNDKMPKVYAFNTFFYPTLIDRGYASLRRWTRKIDIFSQDLIVVPVHLGVHWCVAIIDFRNKAIEYYDSMGHPNNKCLNALLKYLQDESRDKKNTPYDIAGWKTTNMTDIPQQMNGSDCGMFACTFAEYKCRNAKITFTQEDMPYFRRKMVYEILTGRLMMGNDSV